VVAPGAAFASSPWGWAAVGVVTQVLSSGCGAAAAWHNVPLKQPGAVLSGAGGLGGAIGEFAPLVWQKAHADAFPPSVDVCT
jgi:hypothetical protein